MKYSNEIEHQDILNKSNLLLSHLYDNCPEEGVLVSVNSAFLEQALELLQAMAATYEGYYPPRTPASYQSAFEKELTELVESVQ